MIDKGPFIADSSCIGSTAGSRNQLEMKEGRQDASLEPLSVN